MLHYFIVATLLLRGVAKICHYFVSALLREFWTIFLLYFYSIDIFNNSFIYDLTILLFAGTWRCCRRMILPSHTTLITWWNHRVFENSMNVSPAFCLVLNRVKNIIQNLRWCWNLWRRSKSQCYFWMQEMTRLLHLIVRFPDFVFLFGATLLSVFFVDTFKVGIILRV